MKRRQRDDPVALIINVTSSSDETEDDDNQSLSMKRSCKNCRSSHSKCSSLKTGVFPCRRCKEKKLECTSEYTKARKETGSSGSKKSSSSSKKKTNGQSNPSNSSSTHPIVKTEEPPKKKRVVKQECSDDDGISASSQIEKQRSRKQPNGTPSLDNQFPPLSDNLVPRVNRFEQYLERLLSMETSDEEEISTNDRNRTRISPTMYVARWPNGDLNLMSASSLIQVKSMLDEIADPGTAMIYEYDGPLFFGFSPSVRPLTFAEQYMTNQINNLSKTRDTPLHQHFAEFYKKKHMFDCKFRVYDESTKSDVDLECHSAVVLSYSPYLRSLLKPTSTQPVFKFGNKFHYVNKNSLINLIEYLYLGKKIVGTMSELFDIVLCSILMDIEELKHAACLAIISKLFKEGHSPIKPEKAAKIVGVLHFADEHFLNLLIQAIFNRIAREGMREDLKDQGLSKHLSDKLKNWQEFRDGVVWNEDGLTKDISMKLDDSSTYGMKMWHKLTKTAFPNRQFCQSKEDLKEVIISEKTEHELNLAKESASPLTLKRMGRSRVTDNDILRNFYE